MPCHDNSYIIGNDSTLFLCRSLDDGSEGADGGRTGSGRHPVPGHAQCGETGRVDREGAVHIRPAHT